MLETGIKKLLESRIMKRKCAENRGQYATDQVVCRNALNHQNEQNEKESRNFTNGFASVIYLVRESSQAVVTQMNPSLKFIPKLNFNYFLCYRLHLQFLFLHSIILIEN